MALTHFYGHYHLSSSFLIWSTEKIAALPFVSLTGLDVSVWQAWGIALVLLAIGVIGLVKDVGARKKPVGRTFYETDNVSKAEDAAPLVNLFDDIPDVKELIKERVSSNTDTSTEEEAVNDSVTDVNEKNENAREETKEDAPLVNLFDDIPDVKELIKERVSSNTDTDTEEEAVNDSVTDVNEKSENAREEKEDAPLVNLFDNIPDVKELIKERVSSNTDTDTEEEAVNDSVTDVNEKSENAREEKEEDAPYEENTKPPY